MHSNPAVSRGSNLRHGEEIVEETMRINAAVQIFTRLIR